jgi:hypothetical protein
MIEILVFLAAFFAAAPAWADDAGSEPLKAVGGFVVIVLALICVAYLGRLASRIGRDWHALCRGRLLASSAHSRGPRVRTQASG